MPEKIPQYIHDRIAEHIPKVLYHASKAIANCEEFLSDGELLFGDEDTGVQVIIRRIVPDEIKSELGEEN